MGRRVVGVDGLEGRDGGEFAGCVGLPWFDAGRGHTFSVKSR